MLTAGRVNYGSWLLRVIAWDGLLPVVVAGAPMAIERLFPNQRAAIEVLAVALPLAAFLLRYVSGRRHIFSNACSRAVRYVQFCIFCVGILLLALVECVLVLSHVMPNGARAMFENPQDRLIWAILAAIYLTAMTIAMYPGRAPPQPSSSPYPQFDA